MLNARGGFSAVKKLCQATALSICSATMAFAQETITISELLDDGYDIVAASSNENNRQASVFVQKRSSAYMCVTQVNGSVCYSLNDH